jgi:D-glycero-D-manno-heptose 1,7-bisphosphate phosphatase
MSGCIFLDRDGTISAAAPPHQYILSREQVHFLPGALRALAFLNKNSGRKIAIVTNQSPVGRGLMSEEDLDRLHDWMIGQIERAGGYVHEIYVCPHIPDAGCQCRKPKPGLFFQAAQDLHIALGQSVVVGDTAADLEAAHAAGVWECYHVLSGHDEDLRLPFPFTSCDTLWDAAQAIVRQEDQ